MSQESRKPRIFKPAHEEPNDFRMDYILLPYGQFYDKAVEMMKAKPGDILRFFNGRDAEIQAVNLVEGLSLCNILSRMRYGITWEAAMSRWTRYAVFEGNGKDVLAPNMCIMVTFKYL